jgi:hypothetical protein
VLLVLLVIPLGIAIFGVLAPTPDARTVMVQRG